MRAPFQEGDFPGPVKYGYLNVGVVEQGPGDLLGRTVFCLYPHQTRLRRARRRRPTGARRRAGRDGPCSPAPSRPRSTRSGTRGRSSATGSPSSARAWSAAASRACSRGIPGVDVELVDVDRVAADVAAACSASRFAHPDDAAGGRDLVVHTSATGAGCSSRWSCWRPRARSWST